MRLLLVEDEKKVASFIARSLRENLYTVDVAETGEKALDLVGAANYDLVLLDVRLPKLSGIDVCRETQGRRYRNTCPDADRTKSGRAKSGGARRWR